ncbi:MAG: acyl-CoA dehydrogenase [Actinobacteria bacterium]|uniref:Unannotated protein n=1 Tax=freshwater metagenome TaxID=449393 RepID=A0A6J7IWS1_9ZZZZ|nr:acyl-CoA dehydrogenase [Actinomycetota bacterium]
MAPTEIGLSIEPTDRVRDYTSRFARFLDDHVAPIEAELATKDAGTSAVPALDADGRMHPAVQEARGQVRRQAGSLGLYAPHISTEFGGGGFSRVEMHHVEEFVYRNSGLGLGLAALAWTEGPSPAHEHLSPAIREQYLDPIVSGQMSTGFANTEPSVGSDFLAMGARAVSDGSDWILSGTKKWITSAAFSDTFLVTCVTQPGAGTKSLSMFLVDANDAGFRRGANNPSMMNDGLTGELHFDDIRLPAERCVGEIGSGFALAMSWINWRRLCRGGMCAGWGDWLVTRAIEHSHERTSGGKPIADLQAVQHLIAQMDLDTYQARATSLVAQAELDQMGAFSIPLSREAPRLISLVKVINDEAFYRVADRAVQVHGAAGLAIGTPEEKLFRVARNLRIPAGTTEIQYNAISRGRFREKLSG